MFNIPERRKEGVKHARNYPDRDFGISAFRALPRWSHSRDWGYAPTGGVGVVLLIVVILLVLGRI